MKGACHRADTQSNRVNLCVATRNKHVPGAELLEGKMVTGRTTASVCLAVEDHCSQPTNERIVCCCQTQDSVRPRVEPHCRTSRFVSVLLTTEDHWDTKRVEPSVDPAWLTFQTASISRFV